MANLRTRRGALALYAVLLVLPTVALGLLQWRHIEQEHADELASVPRDAEDAARRFRSALGEQLDELLRAEGQRGVEQYANYYCPDSTPQGEVTLLPTQLRSEPRPAGVTGWFTFDLNAARTDGAQVFLGAPSGDPARDAAQQAELLTASLELYERVRSESWLSASSPVELDAARLELPVRAIAASRAAQGDEDCIEAERMLLGQPVRMVAGQFRLHFYRDAQGEPRLIAHRRVRVDAIPYLVGATNCLHRVSEGLGLVQGLFIDTKWYARELARGVAQRVLTKRERLIETHEDGCESCAPHHADLRPIGDFDIDCDPKDLDWGRMQIAIDTTEMDERYRSRLWRFGGVAVMLLAALSTGVALLWRSVEQELEQAARTENFVASVTHELRTPLSSIKLHAEMLLEGWTTDPAKQQEYYRRIVRETERLSTMVERVLEKAKLASASANPVPCDLTELVDAHVQQLLNWRVTEAPDLEFDLAEDLPQVWLTKEALHSILVNLVENARKYAPVDHSKPNAEPIVIATLRRPDGVALEVRDRGPGVPAAQKQRIFDAFYRLGSESTRTTRGTGLGLHLVSLQAASVGARVLVEDRAGGGSIFRVTFKPAQTS